MSYQDQGVLALNVTLHFNKHTHTDIREFQSRPTRLRSESDETDNEYITTFFTAICSVGVQGQMTTANGKT